VEKNNMAPMPGAAPPEQKKGFSWLKCCLIVGCLAIVIGGGAFAFIAYQASKMMMFDPVKVQNLANDIVPCEVPAGYAGFMGMNVAGVKMAMIGPQGMMRGQGMQNGAVNLMIVVMSMPMKQAKEQLKSQMEQQLAKQGHEISAEKAEEETVTVRGAPVKVEKQLTKDKQGNTMIAYVVVLEQTPTETNPAGQEIIWAMGSEKGFDRKALDAFLGSIK
jgi:hypothetical protein